MSQAYNRWWGGLLEVVALWLWEVVALWLWEVVALWVVAL